MKTLATVAAAALVLAGPLAAQQDSTRPGGMGPGHCMGANCPAPGGGPGMGMGMGMGQGMGHMQGRGMMMGMMAMGGPMARTMAFAPTRLLEHKDVLALTERQVQQLTALRDATQKSHDEQHALAEKYMEELTKLAGSTDSAAVRRAFVGHHEAMGSAHWMMLSSAIQAKRLLTDVQRARVEGWVDGMKN
jgi:Spy/CpxP family protein refolding chaperone